MKDHIKPDKHSRYSRLGEIGEGFLSYSILPNLDLFIGDPDIKEVISEFIQIKIEQARKEGREEAIEKIAENLRKEIDDYIALITRIVDFIYNEKKSEFDNKFKITEIRTNFYFGTGLIKILFTIDADLEKELDFANLLNKVEKVVFDKENFICELFYVNKRNVDLDIESINYDYPFKRNIEK